MVILFRVFGWKEMTAEPRLGSLGEKIGEPLWLIQRPQIGDIDAVQRKVSTEVITLHYSKYFLKQFYSNSTGSDFHPHLLGLLGETRPRRAGAPNPCKRSDSFFSTVRWGFSVRCSFAFSCLSPVVVIFLPCCRCCRCCPGCPGCRCCPGCPGCRCCRCCPCCPCCWGCGCILCLRVIDPSSLFPAGPGSRRRSGREVTHDPSRCTIVEDLCWANMLPANGSAAVQPRNNHA